MARAASRDADCDDDDEDYDEEVRTDWWRPWRRRYRVDEPLPDGLPAEIDPDTADELYCWLEPALPRPRAVGPPGPSGRRALFGRRGVKAPSHRLCGAVERSEALARCHPSSEATAWLSGPKSAVPQGDKKLLSSYRQTQTSRPK